MITNLWWNSHNVQLPRYISLYSHINIPNELFYSFPSLLKPSTPLSSFSLSADELNFHFTEETRCNQGSYISAFCCIYPSTASGHMYSPQFCNECPVHASTTGQPLRLWHGPILFTYLRTLQSQFLLLSEDQYFFFLHFIFLIIHTCYFVLHEKKQNKQKHTVLCIIYSNSHPLSFPPFTPKLFPEVLPTCCHQFLSSHFLWNLPYHSFHPCLSLVSALVYIFDDCPLLTQFSDFVVLNLTVSLDRPDPLPSWSRMSHVPGYFLLCQSHMLLIYQIYQCWFDHEAQFLDFSFPFKLIP